MLVLKVTMMEGRSEEQKERLIRLLSEAASRELGHPLDEVRVIIYEVPKRNWGIGGRSVASREAGDG
uniref:Tautomerase n=1 Tax=Thermogemmatispora argillosa TaxID=2045280 RepID=A0A455T1N7_9CHLR|nr:4-oxalocrotonate tautomerase [Thermogemmatispora argillosa]